MEIPQQVIGEFSASLNGVPFTTRRLPFGWAWSPILSQLTIGQIISPITLYFTSVLVLQYLDDILLAADDPYLLTYVGSYCSYLLER